MTFGNIIKNSVLEGFSSSGFSTVGIVVSLGVTCILAAYIFGVYRLLCRRTFYNREFNVSIAVISIVTAGIVIAMQSNLVISLGMVGALSIVRFRTAVKEPMDLLFLFWSIGTGIICGANMYLLAILVSFAVTVGLLVFQAFPIRKSPYLLIVKADRDYAEQELYDALKQYTRDSKIDSKTINKTGVNLIIEFRTEDIDGLMNRISGISGVNSTSFMYHEGEVKA